MVAKKSRNLIKGLVFVLIFSPVLNSQNFQIKQINGRPFYLHKVQKNQTLYGISQKYDVSIDSIIAYNKSAKTVIKTGQTLIIPKPFKNKKNTSQLPVIRHRIKRGETLYRLSKKFKVPIQELIALNPGVEKGIMAGDILLIPLPDTTQTANTNMFNRPLDTTLFYNASITTTADSLLLMPLMQCNASAKNIKKVTIVLLLPFSGNQLHQRLATEFYNGVKVAADSIAKQGIDIHIEVLDAGNPSDKIALQPNKSKLLNADLIIGPLYANQIIDVAEFANKNHIPIISPFAQSTDILAHHPYVIKVTPSKTTIAKSAIDNLAASNLDYNFILVRPYSMVDTLLYFNYKKILLKYANAGNPYVHFVKNSVAATVAKFKQNRKNIVIYPSSKQLPVKSFITNLRFATNDTNMILIGTDQWLRFSILEIGYYSKLNLHVPTPYFYSHKNTKYTPFKKAYIKQFLVKPTFFAYRSYDITTYFVKALLKYGKNLCPCILHSYYCHVCPTQFTFTRQSPTMGFEATSLQVVIFNNMDYTIKKLN